MAGGAKAALDDFRRWYAAPPPHSRFPIAQLPGRYADNLRAKTHAIWLSSATAEKQKHHHPDLDAADYMRVQEVTRRGEAIQDSEHTMIFALNESGGYTAVIKATDDGEELYLTSYRRLSRTRARRDKALRRLQRKAGAVKSSQQ